MRIYEDYNDLYMAGFVPTFRYGRYPRHYDYGVRRGPYYRDHYRRGRYYDANHDYYRGRRGIGFGIGVYPHGLSPFIFF